MTTNLGALASAYVALGVDFKGLQRGLADAKAMVQKWAVAVGGIAIAGLGASATAAAKYERSLAMISTMLGEQASSVLPGYKRELLGLSVTYGQSTETLAKATYDVLSASVDAGQAMDVVSAAAIAAVGGFTSVDIATRGLVNVMNSYHIAASKAAWISDKLFATVARGQFTFEELAGNLGQVAPTAYAAGLSFDEMLGALATITRAGVNPAEAVTQLNSILTTFLKGGSDDAIKTAKQFGIELTQAQLKAGGLIGVMRILSKATAEQVAAIFEESRAMRGVMALTGDLAGFQTDMNTLVNAGGAAMKAYEIVTNTTTQQFARFKNAIFGAAAEIGESLLPFIRQFLDYAIPKIQEWGSSFAAVGAQVSSSAKQIIASLQPLSDWYADADLYLVMYVEETKRAWKQVVDVYAWGVGEAERHLTNLGISIARAGKAASPAFDMGVMQIWRAFVPKEKRAEIDAMILGKAFAVGGAMAGPNIKAAPFPEPKVSDAEMGALAEIGRRRTQKVMSILDVLGGIGGMGTAGSNVPAPSATPAAAASPPAASSPGSTPTSTPSSTGGGFIGLADAWKRMQESVLSLNKDKKVEENTLATMMNTDAMKELIKAFKRSEPEAGAPVGI